MTQDIVERLRKDALSRANGLGEPAGHAWEEEAAAEITTLRAERDEVTAKMAYANSLVEFKNDVLTDRARDMLEVVEAATEWAEDVGSSGYKPRIYPRLYEAVAKLNARGE